jgi:hypothetical protein
MLLLGTINANPLYARLTPYQPDLLKLQILSSEFIPADASAEFPKDCDLKNFSAACFNGKTPAGKVIMHVEDNWVRKYTVTCDADATWSNCSPLPVEQRYEGRRHSNGLTIVVPDAAGQKKPCFYPYSGAAVRSKEHRAARKSTANEARQERATAPAAEAAPAAGRTRCHFTSNPDGAEIQIDGRYSGNTPSEISLAAGTHTIVISMAGYPEWKRELTVTADSEVNVSANLQQSRQ